MPGTGFAAIPGQIGGQDPFGAYDVVKDWPQNISTLPGNEKWTWGAGQGIYAENPNRIYLLFRGELPNIKRPATQAASRLRAELAVPDRPIAVARRDRVGAAGRRRTGQDPDDGPKLWKGTVGVDAKWEHCLTIVDGNGKIVETWTQWDKIFKRPHFVTINPYDPGEARLGGRRSHARDLQVHA